MNGKACKSMCDFIPAATASSNITATYQKGHANCQMLKLKDLLD
jgi:hypothetical protein